MGRRKSEPVEEVINRSAIVEELEDTESELKNFNNEPKDEVKDEPKAENQLSEVDKQRPELLKVAEGGGINQGVKYIKKASFKAL